MARLGLTLQVQATGVGELEYEWYFFGDVLYSSTNSVIQVAPGNGGVYCVRVKDDLGEAVSPAFRVRNLPTSLNHRDASVGLAMDFVRLET